MTTRKRTLVAVFTVLLASLLASGCVITTEEDSTLTIVNDSDFVLVDLRVADVGQFDWGPNLIRSALFPDESVVIALDCGTYDVLIADEFGAECQLLGLDLCFDDALWVIDNGQLAACSF